MTMLKKTLLASVAIAVMTGFVGCGDDDVVAQKKAAAPEIVKEGGLFPADDAQSQEANVNLVIKFDKNVQAGTGKITIKKEDGTVIESIDIKDAKISFKVATEVTINPTNDLSFETGYYVEIESGAITNTDGIAFVGFNDKTKWNFTTKRDGEVVPSSYIPADNAVDQELNVDLGITFGSDVKPGSGKITIKKTSDDAVIESIDITDAKVKFEKSTITINPSADFSFETEYYVVIESGAVTDSKGNKFIGFNDKTKWNFKTKPAVKPLLSKTVRPIGGWSDITGEGGVVTFDSTNKATNDTSFVVTLKRPKNPGADKWPSAIAVGAITEVNLESLSAFVLEYTVTSVTAPTGEVSGLNFGVAHVDAAGEFVIDRESPIKDKWYGSFVATLSTGTTKKGEKQTDTIWVNNNALNSMYLSYCGNSLADKDVYEALKYENPSIETPEDLILLKDNQSVLETTAGVFMHLSHGTDVSEDEVKLTVHSLKALAKDQATIDKIK